MIMSGFDLPLEQGGAPKELRAKYRALLARAVSEGHELGNHLQFDRPAIAMPPEDFDSAFDHCDRLIAELSGGLGRLWTPVQVFLTSAYHGHPSPVDPSYYIRNQRSYQHLQSGHLAGFAPAHYYPRSPYWNTPKEGPGTVMV
ncbi:unnamed protein product [Durusdinium trenchii]